MSSRGARPIDRQCTNPSCRRRRKIPLSDLHYVLVRHPGGTRKDAGWICPCGTENQIPASHLPNGTVLKLRSREEMEEARRPAPVSTPPAERPTDPTDRSDGATPATLEAAVAPEPAPPSPGAPIPAWLSGAAAAAALEAACAAALADPEADVVVLARDEDGLEDFGADDQDLAEARFPEYLREVGCEIAILSGSAGGTAWRAIHLPREGLTTVWGLA